MENDGLVLTCILCPGHLQVPGCVRIPTIFLETDISHERRRLTSGLLQRSGQHPRRDW